MSLADVEDYLDTATKNYDSAKSLKDKQEVHDAFKERLDQMEYDRELIKETEDASMGTGYSQFKNEWVKSHNGDWNGMNEAWKAKQEAMQEEKFDFTQFLNEPYDASSGWSSTM